MDRGIYNNFLIIGGTGRNTGKTTLVEMLVKKLSAKGYKITTLKTSMLLPGEEYLHGNHQLANDNEFILVRENETGNKDSQRYLKAGAEKSFFMSIGKNALKDAVKKFLKTIDKDELVIAESNVLTKSIKPSLFIILKGDTVKESAKLLFKQADVVVSAGDKKEFTKIVDRIKISQAGFVL
jgi:molybdopterin-guanine dinucleotide biosynthesis protein